MNTSNCKDNDSVLEQPKQSKAIRYNTTNYTLEQRIVASVWYHERVYTGMSYDQLKQNFLVRFKMQFPKYSTLRRWECLLFRDGHLSGKPTTTRSVTTLARLIHVPYVKESLIRYPSLSVPARANLLGMSVYTLAKIFKKDLKKEVLINSEKEIMENNEVDLYEQNKMSEDLVRSDNAKDNDVLLN